MRLPLLSCALGAAGLFALSAPASAEMLWLVADGNFLVKVDSTAPNTLLSVQAISGLPAGVQLVGLDFRPGVGTLFGVALDPSAGGAQTLVTIDPRTGVATLSTAGAFDAASTGVGFGVDFNPVADRLRVVDDADANQRVNPITGALVLTDTSLDLAALAESVSGVAYDRNFGGAQLTTLFGIDRIGSQLVTIGGIDGTPSPNTGVLTAIGPLSVTVGDASVGFDISSIDGDAFVSLVDSATGITNLYTVNLATGAATAVGAVGNGVAHYGGLAAAPQGRLSLGADAGKGEGPSVKTYDAQTGIQTTSFAAFDPTFKGGVRVALGDVTGDGIPDVITGSGPKGGARVRVFDGLTGIAVAAPLGDFQPFAVGFTGAVNVAAGDVNGDGRADVIVSPDKGKNAGAHVRVFSGLDGSVLQSFLAYDVKFTQGVRVAAADFDADGFADIVTAPAKGKPMILVFNGAQPGIQLVSPIGDFMAFPAKLKSGVRVATGDVTGDGVPDIVASVGRKVRVIDGLTATPILGPAGEFLSALNGSVHIAAGDIDGDGIAEVIMGAGSGKGSNPRIQVVDGLMAEAVSTNALPLVPFATNFKGGVTVAYASP